VPEGKDKRPADGAENGAGDPSAQHSCVAGPCGRCAEPEAPLSTGDLARACHTTVRTVRFYEEEGLLEPISRSGGHRLFAPIQLQRLQLITDLREAGVSLQDIRALFELKKDCLSAPDAAVRMKGVLVGQIEETQRKIAVLRRLRTELSGMLAAIEECEGCTEPTFQERCGDCGVMNRPDLPRAMRLLWRKK